MNGLISVLVALALAVTISEVRSAETDYNVVNEDGSFKFGLSNNDEGGYYHNAVGTSDEVVRGRYGSRSPASNRLEEVTYSAGPRGFRARGPAIHRKMDLSQVPRGGPKGSIDDPLADPFEDPSYGFRFRTADYQRREDSDRSGRVTGLYSYLDDIGELHSVRYAAGAGTGYQVSNAVPDTPSQVRYNAPLYKTNREVRGKVSYERGPGAQYKFISSGPDQRRSESTGADGITRGSYSYLDDKGVQRTVQYIAGAGIGYRIVQSSTGVVGSHVRPAIPQFGISSSQSGDVSDADGSGFKSGSSSSFGQRKTPGNSGSYDSSGSAESGQGFGSSKTGDGNSVSGFGKGPGSSFGGSKTGQSPTGSSKGPGSFAFGSSNKGTTDFGSGSSSGLGGSSEGQRGAGGRPANNGQWNKGTGSGNAGSGAGSTNQGSDIGSYDGSESSEHSSTTKFGNKNNDVSNTNRGGSGNAIPTSSTGSKPGSYNSGAYKPTTQNSGSYNPGSYNRPSTASTSNTRGGTRFGSNTERPYVTRNQGTLSVNRERDWSEQGRDSTIVTNVGKWYVGLPPGTAVRAHVQNIDLLPLGGRPQSPSDALRKDEQRSLNLGSYDY